LPRYRRKAKKRKKKQQQKEERLRKKAAREAAEKAMLDGEDLDDFELEVNQIQSALHTSFNAILCYSCPFFSFRSNNHFNSTHELTKTALTPPLQTGVGAIARQSQGIDVDALLGDEAADDYSGLGQLPGTIEDDPLLCVPTCTLQSRICSSAVKVVVKTLLLHFWSSFVQLHGLVVVVVVG